MSILSRIQKDSSKAVRNTVESLAGAERARLYAIASIQHQRGVRDAYVIAERQAQAYEQDLRDMQKRGVLSV